MTTWTRAPDGWCCTHPDHGDGIVQASWTDGDNAGRCDAHASDNEEEQCRCAEIALEVGDALRKIAKNDYDHNGRASKGAYWVAHILNGNPRPPWMEEEKTMDDEKCDSCDKEATFFGNCPYDEDVNNELNEVALCDECYQNRCDDI